jgi:hypothetical protein
MNDQTARQFSGSADACSALIDVLIDKGVITADEVLARFRSGPHGHRASGSADGTPGLVEYVVSGSGAAGPQATHRDREALLGETVLVVSDAGAADELRDVLESAGAEVLVARNAVEAMARIAQFDFSSAVIEWRAVSRQHRALVRWLREDGVRILSVSAEPDGTATPPGLPTVPSTARPQDIAAALARLCA